MECLKGWDDFFAVDSGHLDVPSQKISETYRNSQIKKGQFIPYSENDVLSCQQRLTFRMASVPRGKSQANPRARPCGVIEFPTQKVSLDIRRKTRINVGKTRKDELSWIGHMLDMGQHP